MPFSPMIFKANALAQGGFAKPCRFQVLITVPPGVTNHISQTGFMRAVDGLATIVDSIGGSIFGSALTKAGQAGVGRFLALQCETAELPGKMLATHDVKIYGPGIKIPFDAVYTDISLTFVCTNNFYERRFFETWLNAIVPTDSNNPRYRKGPNPYTSDITIIQYDEFIQQIYGIKLIDAFPINVGSMPLSWSEEGFHRLTAGFAYTRYEEISQEKLGFELPDLTNIIGAAAGRILEHTVFTL